MTRREEGVGTKWRAIEIGRAAWGATLLLAPGSTLGRFHHLEVDTRSVVIARVLGARHLGQSVLSGLAPGPEVLALGVWVDAVHASTAFALAAADRRRARAGITDGLVALGWAAVGYRDLRRGVTPLPACDRRRDRLARWFLAIAPGGGSLLDVAQHRQQLT